MNRPRLFSPFLLLFTTSALLSACSTTPPPVKKEEMQPPREITIRVPKGNEIEGEPCGNPDWTKLPPSVNASPQ